MNCRLNKTRIIKQAMPVRYRLAPGIVFQLKTEDMIPFIRAMMGVAKKFNAAQKPDNINILKHTPDHKRLLFRLRLDNQPYQSIIVKTQKIHKLRLRIKYAWMKHYRYGFSEAANLVIAANRGIEVPQVFGYGYIKNGFGLTKTDIVLLEDLGQDSISIVELLEQNKNKPQECGNILDRLIHIFIAHYKAGCNNWDINQGSIIFIWRNGSWYPRVLDFEHIVFYDEPSMENLMFMAGQFAQHLPGWMDIHIVDSWAMKLLDAINIKDDQQRKKWIERFNSHLNSPVLPHKVRQKII
jgi:hypothetical protein